MKQNSWSSLLSNSVKDTTVPRRTPIRQKYAETFIRFTLLSWSLTIGLHLDSSPQSVGARVECQGKTEVILPSSTGITAGLQQ